MVIDMSRVLNAVFIAGLLAVTFPLSAQETGDTPPADDSGGIDAVSQEATRLEGELGKYKDTAPEAGEALFKLTELYHSNGRSFGLVRAAQRFVAARPTDTRHAAVMLRLADGLETLARHKEFTVIARQFLTRYPSAPECAAMEERLAVSLEKTDQREDAAVVYQNRWRREQNPNGRKWGVRACRLFSQLGNANIVIGAELAEEMFDKLPKDEFARSMGERSYWEWRRASQWAKANGMGGKLVKSNLVRQPEKKREILRTMAENYRSLGQYTNAVEVLKQVRAIRDDQWSLNYHIQSLYDSAVPAAQMQAPVQEYLREHPKRMDRYERIGLLALAFNRENNPQQALKLFRSLLGVIPATHSVASHFVQLNGTDPARLVDTEKALRAAIAQCDAANPSQTWALRYQLGISLFRDRLKDNAKAKVALREFIQKSPTNDGNVWNAISWLLSNAENDSEFRSDAAMIMKVRRQYPHWSNLRSYPGNWAKTALMSKEPGVSARGALLQNLVDQSAKDPVFQLISQFRTSATNEREGQLRAKLGEPALFNTYSLEAKRWNLYELGSYYQRYSPGEQRKLSPGYWGRLIELFPKEPSYRYSYLSDATDYGTPEEAKEAALKILELEPTGVSPDVWRRIAMAGDKNMDADLVRKAVAYAKKSYATFGVTNHQYLTGIGDTLLRMELENEAVALWSEVAKPGLTGGEARDSASKLLAKMEDPRQKIAFLKQRFLQDTDNFARYGSWLGDLQLRTGDVAGFESTMRQLKKRMDDRPFRPTDINAYDLHYALHYYRTSHADYRVNPEVENTPENIARVDRAIADVQYDWPSAQAALFLLEAEEPGTQKPMNRLLAWQRVTQQIHGDSHRWDQLIGFASRAIVANDYSVAATLLTGMLENFKATEVGRLQRGRTMVGQCYARLGSVGLTIDENSPLAPLLQAALYLRLGDERLALDTYVANKALYDQHRDEVPVDLTVFICENMLAAGGEENHNKVEDILRGWIIKNSELTTVKDDIKAQIQFLLAKNFFGSRRFDVARSEYQTVIDRYPETVFAVEAEFGIGETFMAQKVYDQAELVFEKLANSRDSEIIVRAEFLRGVLSHRRGDNEEARDIFRTVLERVPNIDLANQALYNLAEVYGDEERYMDQLQLLMTVGRLGRVSKRQHAPGLPLSIVVQDSDLGISRGHNRIPVIITTVPGGDEELVYLTSGGAGKGLFRADVDTELGPITKGDRVLQLTGKDTIKSDYPDEFKSEFKSVPLSDVEIRIAADGQFEVASSKIIDEEEESFSDRLEREAREEELADARQSQQRPTNQIKPGNPIYLRVKDADRDLGDEKDTIVTKLVADSGDQVQVTLNETEPHSGIFEGYAKTGELPAGALATDTAIDHNPLMSIDRDPATFWLSEPDGATPKLLTVDMKDLKSVSRVKFHTPKPDENAPVRAELQASYDGQFWFRVAAHPAIPNAPKVGTEDYGAMKFRLYRGNTTSYTTWQQVLSLANGEPLQESEVVDGQLVWNRPEVDEADKNPMSYVTGVWYGKFVQQKSGAVRFAPRGTRTGMSVNGRLEMELGPGNRTVDVWLDKGVHDLTIFCSAHPNQQILEVVRARSDLNRQQIVFSPFLTSDFDLSQFAPPEVAAADTGPTDGETTAEEGQPTPAEPEADVTLDLETVQLAKTTEQFAVTEPADLPKSIGFWQNLEDVASWEFDAPAGIYDVWLEYAHQYGSARVRVELGDQRFTAPVPATGNYSTYRKERFGTIVIDEPGKAKLVVRPDTLGNGVLMNLRKVELRAASGTRVVLADTSWEFRFDPHDVRYTRLVINEYLGEAVAISHIEVSGEDIKAPFIPTESDVLALAQNDQLEIAGGDVVTATYTDEVTQINSGASRLLAGKLQATYFNGSVSPIAYDFIRQNNGAVANVRKRLKRVDPGERVTVEITDYDRDISVSRDKLQFEVSVNDGEPITLTATETEENTGLFTKEVDTAAVAEGDKLVVKEGDRINIKYIDEQNTFPGHSVPRESVVYVNRPTEGLIRILESKVIPPPEGSKQRPGFIYQIPKAEQLADAGEVAALGPEEAEPGETEPAGTEPGETEPAGTKPDSEATPTTAGETEPAADSDAATLITTNVAFEAPLTVEVIDPDAAKDSESEITVRLTTTDGATVDVLCRISSAFTNVPNIDGEDWALEEGRFVGQIVMQLGSKASPVVVPVTSEMPRSLIGGGILAEEEGMSNMDMGLVAAVLNLTGKDRITGTYNDERRPDGKPAALPSYGRLISNGELASVDRDYDKPVESLHVGEKLFLVVTDPDQDSSDERDMVDIEITSEFGEKESVQLTETLAHSGVFTGSLTLKSTEEPTAGNIEANNPHVEAYFGDTLTVTYLDPAASNDEGQLELTTTLPVVIGTDGLVSAFSKTFNNETLAVETRFHIAESYFELFKSHKNLGRQEESAIDLDAGRRVLREVMEDFPDPKYQPRILYLLGQFAQELGGIEEATDSYEQIVRQFPEHPLASDAQYKLAQTYEEAGDFDEALEAYVTLAATYPKSPLIANVMIRISDHFYKGEEYPIAAEVGKKFLEKFEGHQYASRMAFRVGQCYYKAEDYTVAGKSFDEFAKIFPDDDLASDSLFWAGESFRMASNNRDAFRRYNRCRWDYPASDAAKYARGRLALPEMLQQFEAEANSVEDNN